MIIKNALKNISRNKGRTVLITLVIGIVMVASSCSIVVYNSAKQLAIKQMEEVGAQVIITRNDEKLVKHSDMSNYQEISVKQMQSFTNSSFIKSSAIYASAVGKTTLEPIAGSGLSNAVEKDNTKASDAQNAKDLEENDDGMVEQSGGKEAELINPKDSQVVVAQTEGEDVDPTNQEGSQNPFSIESPNILLIASNNKKISDDFISGLRKIKEGSMYKKEKEVLISEELAKKNHLKVGDTFEVKLIDLSQGNQVPSITLTISGIFEDHKPMGDSDAGLLNKSNEVLMNYETLAMIKTADSNAGGISVEGSFQLKNPNDVKALEKEFHKKGMPEYYELSVNRNAYEISVAPIVQVADMALLFSVLIVGVGALIIITLSLLIMKERKYEIGVLRAMGMKKKNLCFMICIEMCMICLICAILAISIAKIGAQPIANLLLNGVESTPSIQFGAFFVGNGGSISISNIATNLSSWTIIMVFIISILLGLLGSVSGIWYITKNEPMRILAERNE